MSGKKAGILALCIVALAIAVFTGAAAKRTAMNGDELYANSEQAIFYVRALKENGVLKSSGTGFLTESDGTALTAAHVVGGAASVNVVLPSGEELVGVPVEYIDTVTDIAVLKLPPRGDGYPHIALAEEAPRSGERLYAVGYPQKGLKIISDGVVSAPEGSINGLSRLLMSADLASGMSGGPVISQYGEVIGLSTATVRTMNGVSTAATAEQMLDALEQAEKGSEQK